MDIYLSALLASLTPQVVFALIGGLMGVIFKHKQENFYWVYTVFISIGSLFAVGSLAEYLQIKHEVSSLFLHGFIGIISGIIGANLLHSINLFAPQFAKNIVKKIEKKIFEKIDKI